MERDDGGGEGQRGERREVWSSIEVLIRTVSFIFVVTTLEPGDTKPSGG